MKYLALLLLLSGCTVTVHCKCDCEKQTKGATLTSGLPYWNGMYHLPSTRLTDTVLVKDGNKKLSYWIIK